jgi:hypothetical protein
MIRDFVDNARECGFRARSPLMVPLLITDVCGYILPLLQGVFPFFRPEIGIACLGL